MPGFSAAVALGLTSTVIWNAWISWQTLRTEAERF